MTKRKMLGWGACGAAAVAFLSFFMDFAEFYGVMSMTGFDLLEFSSDFDDGIYMIIALIATGVGLVAGLISNSKDGNFSLPMLCSIVSVICMWLFFSEGMDYAAGGFWIFMIAHVASAVLSVMASNADE